MVMPSLPRIDETAVAREVDKMSNLASFFLKTKSSYGRIVVRINSASDREDSRAGVVV